MLFRYVTIMFMLVGLSLPVAAQGRPDARTMSCEEVRAMIATRGAVVLTTGRHTYDRYVAGSHFCPPPDVARPETIRTRDADQCMVFACRPSPFDADW